MFGRNDFVENVKSALAAVDDIHLTVGRLLAGYKLDEWHPVSIREKLLDFFLVTY